MTRNLITSSDAARQRGIGTDCQPYAAAENTQKAARLAKAKAALHNALKRYGALRALQNREA